VYWPFDWGTQVPEVPQGEPTQPSGEEEEEEEEEEGKVRSQRRGGGGGGAG